MTTNKIDALRERESRDRDARGIRSLPKKGIISRIFIEEKTGIDLDVMRIYGTELLWWRTASEKQESCVLCKKLVTEVARWTNTFGECAHTNCVTVHREE